MDYNLEAKQTEQIDTVPMVGLFFSFKSEVAKLNDDLQALTVNSDESLAMAADTANAARKLKNTVNKRLKEVVKPLADAKKHVESKVKESVIAPLEKIELTADDKSKPYLLKKEEERRAAEAKAREQAEQMDPSSAVPIVPEIVDAKTTISTSAGSMTVETEKEPEIVDLAAAVSDPGFLKARAKWIEPQVLTYARQCLKMGKLNIPGVVFNDVPKIKRRVK